jgi:Protein of unknown function (DUF1289)
MKFTPCMDLCTYEGTHCEGCGRSRQEIANTKKIVMTIAGFIESQGYENADEFMAAITKSVLKKVQKPS